MMDETYITEEELRLLAMLDPHSYQVYKLSYGGHESMDDAYDPQADIPEEAWGWECSECGTNAAQSIGEEPGGVPMDWAPEFSQSLCCGSPMQETSCGNQLSAILIQKNAA